MAMAYCAKCEKKVEIKNPKKVTMDGRGAIQGVCPICGAKVVRFVASDESVKKAVKEVLEKTHEKSGSA